MDLKQRFAAIEAPSIVGSASPYLPMGCAKTLATMVLDNYHHGAHDALADPSAIACGPRRSLPVAPLIADKRCYGEAPVWFRWGYGGISTRQGGMGWDSPVAMIPVSPVRCGPFDSGDEVH